jgi:hypothetical protein
MPRRWVGSLVGSLLLAATSGCNGTIGERGGLVEATGPVVVEVLAGAPADGKTIDRVPVASASAPDLVSLVDGVVAVGTPDGVLVGSVLEHDLLAELPLLADDDEPEETGAIQHLARRATGGLLVAAEGGLFHSATGILLPSPLSASLEDITFASLDAIGDGAAEELWIVDGEGTLLHVAHGMLAALTLPGGEGVDVAVGVGNGLALVVRGGDAALVDVHAQSVTALAGALGEVHAFDRSDDGAAFLATDAGLLGRDRDGSLTLRTFAAEGEPALPALAVSASFGALLVGTAAGLVDVDLDEGTATWLDDDVAALPGSITVDALGDAWAIDDGELYRYRTGEPVSFASDVEPFFEQHCTSCHDQGLEGAPVLVLTDYSVAEDRALTILSRLRAVGVSPMPPANTEILTAQDYSVVTRWVASGKNP